MSTNILHILSVAERGGAERIHESWATHLNQSYRVHVVVPKPGALQASLEKLGIQVVVPPDFRLKNLANSVKFLQDYIRTNAIDLIHASMPYGHAFGGLASMGSGRPEIWSSHGPMAPRRYQGWIPLIPSAAVLVHSHHMYDLQKSSTYNSRRIRLVPYGVDTRQLQPNPNNRSLIRSQYGIPADALVIGIVGRLTRWKGQDVVLKAFRQLKQQFPALYCMIIGDSIFGVGNDFRAEIQRLTQDLDLNDVIFTGFAENVYDYYDALDVAIHASIVPEPFGLVVAEAMAKGKIVVATKGGGPSEMIAHGISGFLYNAGNVQELTAVLSQILDSLDTLQTSVGQQAREAILQNFSIEGSTKVLESVYREVLST